MRSPGTPTERNTSAALTVGCGDAWRRHVGLGGAAAAGHRDPGVRQGGQRDDQACEATRGDLRERAGHRSPSLGRDQYLAGAQRATGAGARRNHAVQAGREDLRPREKRRRPLLGQKLVHLVFACPAAGPSQACVAEPVACDVDQLITLTARLPERVTGCGGQAPVRLREKLALPLALAGVQEHEDVSGDFSQERLDVGRCLAARVHRPRVVGERRPPKHSVDRHYLRHTRSVMAQHGPFDAFTDASCLRARSALSVTPGRVSSHSGHRHAGARGASACRSHDARPPFRALPIE